MGKTPKISICIPTYEAKGMGVELLSNNINSILNQTYENYEIIISDHSINDEIKNYVNELNSDKIKYLKNVDNVGWPSYNTNNAISNSSGDYIKLMNQDDFFKDNDSLESIVNKLKEGYEWVLCGFTHKNLSTGDFFNTITPSIKGDGKHLLLGQNTIGCPSVGLIPKNEFFDVNVIYMIDCELWYQMFKKYGNPGIVEDVKIIIGIGSHTLTSQLTEKQNEWLSKDIKYCKNKYEI